MEGKKLLDRLTKLTDKLKADTDKLEKALGHESNGSADKHAKHYPRQRHPGDGGPARSGRRARNRSSRTDCGRWRRTGRCCSSSKAQGSGLRAQGSRLRLKAQGLAAKAKAHGLSARRRDRP